MISSVSSLIACDYFLMRTFVIFDISNIISRKASYYIGDPVSHVVTEKKIVFLECVIINSIEYVLIGKDNQRIMGDMQCQ